MASNKRLENYYLAKHKLQQFPDEHLKPAPLVVSVAVVSLIFAAYQVRTEDRTMRRDLQRRLVADGFRLRLYIPFGKAWYPYFMRRLAERPANLLFLARNLWRD